MRERRFRQRRDRRSRMTQTAQGQGQGYQPDGAGSCEGTNHVREVSLRGQTVSASSGHSIRNGKNLPADRLQTHLRAEEPGRHALDDPPIPDAGGIEAGVRCKPS
jgi:hypothetical protein